MHARLLPLTHWYVFVFAHMHSGSISYESITSRYQNTKNQYDKFLGTYNCYIPSLIPPKNGRSEYHPSHLRCFQVQAEMLNISIVATSTGGFKTRETSRGWSIGFQKWQEAIRAEIMCFPVFFFVGKHLVNNMCFTTYSSSLCFHCSCAWEAFHSEPTCCWIAIR